MTARTALAAHPGVPLTDIVTAGEGPALQVTRASEGTIVRGDGLEGPQDAAVTLADGDFLSFSADRPHRYESRAAVARATLLLWYLPPAP